MEKQLTELYDGVILEHNRSPFNYEKRNDAQHIVDAYNPLCGDKFKLYLDIDNRNIVSKATFHGYGCAVSKAATSVLVKKIEGLPVNNVLKLLHNYTNRLNLEHKSDAEIGDTEGGQNEDELSAFEAVKKFPERLTCATLSWEAAQDFFSKLEN